MPEKILNIGELISNFLKMPINSCQIPKRIRIEPTVIDNIFINELGYIIE